MSEAEAGDILADQSAGKATLQPQAVPALIAITAARWVVYWGTTPQGQRYIGITSDLARRSAQHLASTGTRIFNANFGRMDYFSAKALEQKLINLGGGPGSLANKINSIATSNPLYNSAMNFAANRIEELKKCGASAIPGINW